MENAGISTGDLGSEDYRIVFVCCQFSQEFIESRHHFGGVPVESGRDEGVVVYLDGLEERTPPPTCSTSSFAVSGLLFFIL